jgi:hypothetical protein
VIITSPDPYKLQDLLRRERARHALIPRSGVVEVEPGLWAVQAVMLRRPRPAWLVPAAVTGGVLAGVALVAWTVVTLVSLVVSFALPLAGIVAVTALVLRVTRPRAGGGCTVTITHRHH